MTEPEYIPTRADMDRVAMSVFGALTPEYRTAITAKIMEGGRPNASDASGIIAMLHLVRRQRAGAPIHEDDPLSMGDAARSACWYFLTVDKNLDLYALERLVPMIQSTGAPGDLILDGLRAGMDEAELQGALSTGEWPPREALDVLITLRRNAEGAPRK